MKLIPGAFAGRSGSALRKFSVLFFNFFLFFSAQAQFRRNSPIKIEEWEIACILLLLLIILAAVVLVISGYIIFRIMNALSATRRRRPFLTIILMGVSLIFTIPLMVMNDVEDIAAIVTLLISTGLGGGIIGYYLSVPEEE